MLVVGASHSGADIAHELAADYDTYLAGRSHGQLPFSVDGRVGRATWPLIRLLATKVFTLATPVGRSLAPQVRMGGGPLLRHRRQDLLGAGVEWIEERVGIDARRTVLRALEIAPSFEDAQDLLLQIRAGGGGTEP